MVYTFGQAHCIKDNVLLDDTCGSDGLKTSEYLVRTAVRNIEGEISFEEANALLSERAFSFTPNEYLSIHRKLFTGIYFHAGCIRDYNITKKEWVLDGATVLYGSATELRATLDYDFSEEKKFSYQNLSMDEIIHHLALFVSRLWQIRVFGEGNTRTAAVFFIRYLRTLGFDVTNDIFAENVWYFRNSLVRANYNDLKNGIHETTEYLELFLRNLLLKENHPLHNRTLHISGTFKETEKSDIETAKLDIDAIKADIEKLFQPKTVSHILRLREAFPRQTIFGRSDVMEVIDIKPSRESELLREMAEYGVIEPISGHGKGKYRFCL